MQYITLSPYRAPRLSTPHLIFQRTQSLERNGCCPFRSLLGISFGLLSLFLIVVEICLSNGIAEILSGVESFLNSSGVTSHSINEGLRCLESFFVSFQKSAQVNKMQSSIAVSVRQPDSRDTRQPNYMRYHTLQHHLRSLISKEFDYVLCPPVQHTSISYTFL